MSNNAEYYPKILQVKPIKNIFSRFLEATPLIVVCIAIISLYISNNNLNKTLKLQNKALELQNEQRAVDLYNRYYLVSKDKPEYCDITYASDSNNWTKNYKIFAQYVIFLSEAIYMQCNDKPEWRATIESMLYPHLRYYLLNDFFDATFNDEFKKYCFKLIEKYRIKR